MGTHLPGDSPQINLINEWNRGWTEGNLATLEKHLHKDYHKFTYPESIGQPAMNREEWLEHAKRTFKFSTPSGNLHSFMDAPNLGKVIFHVTYEAKYKQGLKATRESIFVMSIVTDDDGSLKVKQTDEFTDPKGFSGFAGAAKAVNTSQ